MKIFHIRHNDTALPFGSECRRRKHTSPIKTESQHIYQFSNATATVHQLRAWGGVVAKTLRYYSEGPGIDPRGIRQFHVPWGRLSL